ncbi:MAG: aminopeptidase [Candidatus Aminicenantes bacterium]|nr:MAG: aminopeptidase [Candidatus Aminicenantes bacterium]
MSAKISQKDLETWANYILNHSLGGIKPEDIVMIKGEHITWPLMSVLQDKIFAAGAIADINLVAPDNDRGKVWGASITKFGTLEQINRVPEWHHSRYQAMTKYIEILGAENPALFANLPEKTAAELMKADHPFKTIRLAKSWVLTLFPTQAFAELEGMSLEEYTNIIVKASTTDHKMLGEIEEPLAQLMEKAKTIRIQTQCPKTGNRLELEMDISDRFVVRCVGERNFPDGEIYTSPDANSTTGEIFVDLPVYYNGVTIQGIYLKFENGIIKEYSAEKEPKTLKKIIETDEGSHRIGEVALGMNSGLQTALKHPLFVEKVGGTLHIAIGESYPECYVKDPASEEGKAQLDEFFKKGIINKSAQHVDIVTDFRPGGAGRAVYFDNTKLEIKNNIWTIP